METFSDHARDRMRSRSISEELVVITLVQPDRTFIGAQGNLIAEKAFGQARLRVVYENRLGPSGVLVRHVITVMWR